MSRTTPPCGCSAETANAPDFYLLQIQKEIRAIEEIFHCLILFESVLDPANAGAVVLDADHMASWLRVVNRRFSARINAAQEVIESAKYADGRDVPRAHEFNR